MCFVWTYIFKSSKWGAIVGAIVPKQYPTRAQASCYSESRIHIVVPNLLVWYLPYDTRTWYKLYIITSWSFLPSKHQGWLDPPQACIHPVHNVLFRYRVREREVEQKSNEIYGNLDPVHSNYFNIITYRCTASFYTCKLTHSTRWYPPLHRWYLDRSTLPTREGILPNRQGRSHPCWAQPWVR